MLRRLEWVPGFVDGRSTFGCPMCGQIRAAVDVSIPGIGSIGHLPTCELASLLKDLP
jgi:hypothetical protein